MGVKIINRRYTEAYTDGEIDWLLGNVGEWQKCYIDVEVAINFSPTVELPVQMLTVDMKLILSQGNWGDYGFDIGDFVRMTYRRLFTDDDGNESTISSTRFFTILNLFGDTMEHDGVFFSSGSSGPFNGNPTLPYDRGSAKVYDISFEVNKQPEGCRMNYAHITNDNIESSNLSSFIDGTISEFVQPNLGTSSSTYTEMEAVGIQSGMSIRSIKVRNQGRKAETYNTFKYQFIIHFMISSFFESLQNFTELQMPSYLSGDGSLTDQFNIEFYPEWNNPNTVIRNDLKRTQRLGNTGWFNENFNELTNDFTVQSIQYFDTDDNVVQQMDYFSPTKVRIEVLGVPNVNFESEMGFGFAWIPTNEDDYKEKETPFYQNLFVLSGAVEQGFVLNLPFSPFGAGVDGGAMNSSFVTWTNENGVLVMEATFVPNSAFASIFDAKDDNDRNYILWVSVADGSLERNFSDRVSLLVDVNKMVKTIPPAGPYGFIGNQFYDHPQGLNSLNGGIAINPEFNGIVQDEFLAYTPFRIKRDGSTKFRKFTYGMEVFNAGESNTFDLERFEIDLQQYPVSGGIQQIDYDEERGFKLEAGNNKNWVKIMRSPSSDNDDFAFYKAYFATKIRWEDWILNQDAPDEFFNADELNTGFNNDWVQYLRTSGWEVNFFTEIEAEVNGELLRYRNKWKVNFNDYDENNNVAKMTKYYRQETDTLLNLGADPVSGQDLGVILNNDVTRIEVDFIIQDENPDVVWELEDLYGIITLEIDFGGGRFEQRQLSSVWGSEEDNPLRPLEEEEKLKIESSGMGKVLTLSCLVSPEFLDPASRYRVTGRVGCCRGCGPEGSGSGGTGNNDNGLYEDRYENRYE